MKKKPSWFRLDDLLTIAGPGLAILGLDLYAYLTGIAGDRKTEAAVLMAVVGVAFLVIWVRILFSRKTALSKYKWYPTYGIMAHDDGGKYHLPGVVLFEALVWRTIQDWAPYYKANVLLKDSDTIWVYFKKDLDESPKNLAHRKVEGLTISGAHTIMVDYDSANHPIEKTALAHELGHLIMGHASGNWDLVTHHDFAKKYNLR